MSVVFRCSCPWATVAVSQCRRTISEGEDGPVQVTDREDRGSDRPVAVLATEKVIPNMHHKRTSTALHQIWEEGTQSLLQVCSPRCTGQYSVPPSQGRCAKVGPLISLQVRRLAATLWKDITAWAQGLGLGMCHCIALDDSTPPSIID